MDARFQLSLDFHFGHAYLGFWPDRVAQSRPSLSDPKPSLVFGFGMSAFMLSQQVFEQFIFFGEQRKSIEQSPRIPPCGQMLSA